MMKFVALLAGILFFGAAQARDLMVVGEDSPPFEFMQDDQPVGVNVDLIDALLERQGLKASYHIMPFSRAWRMVQKGQAEIGFSTSVKEKRKPYVHYTADHTWQTDAVFFTRKDAKLEEFQTYQTIKNRRLKVAVVKAHTYHPSFWRHFPDREDGRKHELLDVMRDNSHALKALRSGRVDVAIMDRTVGRHLLGNMGFEDEISWYPEVLYSKPYPLVFSKASAYKDIDKIRQQFDKDLAEMKKNGEYRAIMCRWKALPLSDCTR